MHIVPVATGSRSMRNPTSFQTGAIDSILSPFVVFSVISCCFIPGTQNTVTNKILHKCFICQQLWKHVPFHIQCSRFSFFVLTVHLCFGFCKGISALAKEQEKMKRVSGSVIKSCTPVLMVLDALGVQYLGLGWLAISEGGVPVSC